MYVTSHEENKVTKEKSVPVCAGAPFPLPVVHRTSRAGSAPINIRPPARTLRLRELLSPVKALHGHRAPPLSRLRLSARAGGESGELPACRETEFGELVSN